MPKEEKVFRLNWIAFFIAFAVGMFYVYISSPKPRLIIKYPTPYNANKVTYQNDDNVCYKYDTEEVKCTDTAIPQPIT
jgi:hypothetical protein